MHEVRVDGQMTEKDEKLRHVMGDVLAKGMRRSLEVSWLMLKIYVPVSLLTVVMKQWGVLDFIVPFFTPFMGLMGLPGEAAITVVAGFVNTIYAALATISAFDLTARQITVLGVVLGLSHSLFVETAILTKLRMATVRIALFRMAAAFLAGMLMNAILPQKLGGTVTPYKSGGEAFSWLLTIQNIALTSFRIVIIITLLMVLHEMAARWKHSAAIKAKLQLLPKAVGMSEKVFAPWMVGFFIGITYGAAVLLQLVKDHQLSHKDACLITIFLCLAHAIIEDTVIFAIVGGNFWWVIVSRVSMAVLTVRLLSLGDLYRRFLWVGLPRKMIQ